MRRDRHGRERSDRVHGRGLVGPPRDLGVRRISLNFAMFRSCLAPADAVGAGRSGLPRGAVVRLAGSGSWSRCTARTTKYRPTWLPRFLCYDSSLTLSRVGARRGHRRGLPAARRPGRARRRRRAVGDRPFLPPRCGRPGGELPRPVRPSRRLSQQETARLAKLDTLSALGTGALPGGGAPHPRPRAQIRAGHPGLGPGRARPATRWRSPDGSARCGIWAVCRSRCSRTARRPAGHAAERRHPGRTGSVAPHGRPRRPGQRHRRGGHSRRGELSVQAGEWAMAAKCLRPLPDAHAGFTDPEARSASATSTSGQPGRDASATGPQHRGLQALRDAFTGRGFLEVETPMLQPVHGGANARPFHTHINAYDTDCTCGSPPSSTSSGSASAACEQGLRARPQFPQRGRRRHPQSGVHLARGLPGFRRLHHDAQADPRTDHRRGHRGARPSDRRRRPDGTEVDLSRPWPVVPCTTRCRRRAASSDPPDARELMRDLARHGCRPGRRAAGASRSSSSTSAGRERRRRRLLHRLPARDLAADPTAPLRPRLAERWDLVAFGMELGTAYSELIDPIDQRDRLTAQSCRPPRAIRGHADRRGLPDAPWNTPCRRPAASDWA